MTLLPGCCRMDGRSRGLPVVLLCCFPLFVWVCFGLASALVAGFPGCLVCARATSLSAGGCCVGHGLGWGRLRGSRWYWSCEDCPLGCTLM
jgi:hypothetical protein